MRLAGASVAVCSSSASSHPRLRRLVPVCLVAFASFGTVARASTGDHLEPAAAPEPAAATQPKAAPEPAAAPGPAAAPELGPDSRPDSRPESDHDAEAQSGPPPPVPPLGGSPPPPPPPAPAAAPARPRGPAVGKSKPPPAALPARSPPHPNEVTIRLLVQPPGIAHVLWGTKDLGVAPLDLVRPRGSGPLDLTLRAVGYLTFHTRAFTEHDDKIAIRMVLSSEAARFPGFAGLGAPAPAPTRPTGSSDHARGRASGAR